MHSCETPPAAPPPATGPNLLLELGKLIIRSRSVSPSARTHQHDRLLQAKLLSANASGSTSQQVQTQPRAEREEAKPGLEAQLSSHVTALWTGQIPICIEVLLGSDCADCQSSPRRDQKGLLLERWTMYPLAHKAHECQAFSSAHWTMTAVRSQLHFSQLAAWRDQRRRKLSRETCNYKKLEANCDEKELPDSERQQNELNIVYSIKIPGECYKMTEFTKPPIDHTFPFTDIGNNMYLKVVLESLPRSDSIPKVKCSCPPKRRVSKEFTDDLAGKFNDLNIGSKYSKDTFNSNTGNTSRRLSIISNPDKNEFHFTTDPDEKQIKVLDDRMHTTCSKNGKHKCNCDDESDANNQRSSTSVSHQETKKIDEKRLKEIAKYKRRLRKENKLKKLSDSTSSEGDNVKTHTSIPILQAARFDRFRAIGCYRNQTYLTLPASRIESRSPFIESISIPPADFKKTNTIGTQTDDMVCRCGNVLSAKCDCCRKMVRSEANYDLASVDQSKDGARKMDEECKGNQTKKHKCDKYFNSNIKCDIENIDDRFNISDNDATATKINSDDTAYSTVAPLAANPITSCNEIDSPNIGTVLLTPESDYAAKENIDNVIIRRPKLKRFFPKIDRIEKVLSDRNCIREAKNDDIKDLHLNNDDTVFLTPNLEAKRQKTFSISEEDYILYEKCDYGTIDTCEAESPVEESYNFKFPEPQKIVISKEQENLIPSPSEMDRFRWRFDSAASMVFHTKTGLPLTSSPAPLRRGNNCFDFDDSINGISGIKSALFHPISPPDRALSADCPAAAAAKPSPAKRERRLGPSAGLLGSFEESALQGRLEAAATVAGFTAELGASGAFCPAHRRLPVTVFFYAPGGTNAPYMGHIALGAGGYRVPRSGTVQASLFNPHGTLVKMFVVLYDLTQMPPHARTFLRQRTLYLPAGAPEPPPREAHQWLRYLIHLRFMTSKSGKLYLHSDIRIIVSRKADLDTATAHSALARPLRAREEQEGPGRPRGPSRVFGGCGAFAEGPAEGPAESYELRSFTYAPENPRFSPR